MKTNASARSCRSLPALVAGLLVAGCASTLPAPVVNRTPPALPPVQAMPLPVPPAPVSTMPGDPAVSGQTMPGQLPEMPGTALPGGVETSPIRSGSVESATAVPSAPAADPNLKTGPRGFKRPFGEMAALDPRVAARAGAMPAPAQPAAPEAEGRSPVAVASAPPTVITVTPATAPVAPPAAGGSGRLDGVTFSWPAAGSVIQTFNDTSNKGLGLGGRAGDAILAAADGRVIFSGAGPRGYGNLVIVKHTNDVLSVYAHNRSLAVKEGDSVKRGQKIAELGNSGTDRPKLHFEIRQQGKPIDPLAVLPRR